MVRCTECALLEQSCVCNDLFRISTEPHTVIIRHCKEKKRGSNSARILDLSLDNSTLLDYGCSGEPLPNLNHFDLTRAALVFPLFYDANPEYPPQPVESLESIQTLILLDGSWKQASRMLRRIPNFLSIPRLEISPASPPLPRIRHPYFEGGMCTMEAGIQALRKFNSEEAIEQLTQNYLIWLNAMRRLSGIRKPLSAGQSFKDARKIQDAEDAKRKPN